MPTSFNLPDSLLYSAPSQNVDGEINWVQFPPVYGTTFSPSQSFKIKIASANEFLVPQRSYLRFDLTITASTIGNVVTSTLGGASVLKRITTTCAGVQIEDIDHYNAYCSAIYKRLPNTNKDFLEQSEGYLDTDAFSTASGRSVYHPLRTALLEQDKYVPLAFLSSGVELDIELAPLVALQASAAGTPSTYTISNVQFVACMMKPSDSYLQGFQKSLASGNVGQVALQLTRNIRVSPSATTEQEANIHLGFLKSLRSLIGINRLTATFGAAVDTFDNDNNEGLKSYYFQIGTTRYPRNKAIECSVDSGPYQVENMMQALCSLDNTFSHFNQPAASGTTGNYVYFNWSSSPLIGSGVPVEDGTISIVRSYNSAPATTSVCDLYFNYDAVLKFNAVDVWLDTKNI